MEIQTKVISQCNCEKCGYKWFSRVENPKECPRCKTRIKWDVEEVKKIVKVE